MYHKEKVKPVRVPTRPTALQQLKVEIGDSVLTKQETKILQQKFGITDAELILSEKFLIEEVDGIQLTRRRR